MYECVILLRFQSGVVGAIMDADYQDNIAIFSNRDDAISFSETNVACQALPFQIVELDEL